MVAPSFQDMEIVNNVYTKAGKQYVDVRHPRTGNIRSVRWYTDIEYEKSYGKKICTKNKYGGLKVARGFKNGDIFVLFGVTEEDEPYLRYRQEFRFSVETGWYVASTDKIPDDIPSHIKIISLSWDDIKGSDEESLKSSQEIRNIILSKKDVA